jgi:hypothetical protein
MYMQLLRVFCMSIILCLLLISNTAMAQSPKKLNLAGTLKIKDIGLIVYELQLQDDGKGKLNGTSTTGRGTDNVVKSKVSGNINYAKNTITITEAQLPGTTAYNHEALCFVQGTFAYKLKAGKTIIEGQFTGKDTKGANCGSGKLSMICLTPFTTYDTLKSIKSKKEVEVIKKQADAAPAIVTTPSSTATANANVQKEFTYNTKNIYYYSQHKLHLSLSDFDKEDGDKVNIYYNDVLLISNYTLSNKTYEFDIIIQNPKDDNTIVLEAINEGYYPTNSALLVITDGEQQYKVKLSNEADKKITIQLKPKN